jgi:hypothetical protein
VPQVLEVRAEKRVDSAGLRRVISSIAMERDWPAILLSILQNSKRF